MTGQGTEAQPSALRTWGVRGALLLGYGSLFLVSSTFKYQGHKYESPRTQLAPIKISPKVSPKGVKGWLAVFEVDVHPKKAWYYMSMCTRYHKLLGGLLDCKLLKQGTQDGKTWYEYHLTVKNPRGWWMVTRAENDEKKYIHRWRMTKGSFSAASGYIKLFNHPKHKGWSLVHYGYFLSISKLLPESFELPKTRRAVRNTVRDIQRYFSPERVKWREQRIKAWREKKKFEKARRLKAWRERKKREKEKRLKEQMEAGMQP